jgi:hypothetical protein
MGCDAVLLDEKICVLKDHSAFVLRVKQQGIYLESLTLNKSLHYFGMSKIARQTTQRNTPDNSNHHHR